MSLVDQTRWICEQAHALEFDLCGVVAARVFDELSRLPDWLSRGYAGEMNYLTDPRRADPNLVFKGARSIIVTALNYNSPRPYSMQFPTNASAHDNSPRGWISRYAWGDDYHQVVKRKLDSLVAAMRVHFTEHFEARAYVDTGPVIERIAAKYAGMGWLAKNTCLINEEFGSWLFLGVILTTLELSPTLAQNEPPPADLCGNCTLCLDACPTRAFAAPYVLDARRCISYLTIELRGAIPDEFRPAVGRNIFGCDICQDVCPWNRKALATQMAAFQPRECVATEDGCDKPGVSLFAPHLEWLASLSEKEFSEMFRGSAIKRAKWRGLIRNACVALGNSQMDRNSPAYRRVIELLGRLASSHDDLIVEHSKWALARLQPGNK
jgi:epoxyqueuosine reductase